MHFMIVVCLFWFPATLLGATPRSPIRCSTASASCLLGWAWAFVNTSWMYNALTGLNEGFQTYYAPFRNLASPLAAGVAGAHDGAVGLGDSKNTVCLVWFLCLFYFFCFLFLSCAHGSRTSDSCLS